MAGAGEGARRSHPLVRHRLTAGGVPPWSSGSHRQSIIPAEFHVVGAGETLVRQPGGGFPGALEVPVQDAEPGPGDEDFYAD